MGFWSNVIGGATGGLAYAGTKAKEIDTEQARAEAAAQKKEAEYQAYLTANPGMVDPRLAQDDPRGTMATIIRNQWTDFQGTTVPIIKGLEGMTTYAGNKGIVDGLQTDARNNAKAAFGNVVNDAQGTAQGYGMSLSPAETGTLSRASKLGMAAATTDGVNRANDFQQDLNRQITAGSSLSTVKGA